MRSGRGSHFCISQTIRRIRHSATLVAQLEPKLQRAARDSYAISLRAVFLLAAASTFLAYLARLPVGHVSASLCPSHNDPLVQIPDKSLDSAPRKGSTSAPEPEPPITPPENPLEETVDAVEDAPDDDDALPPMRPPRKVRRLSTYESSDGGMDLEGEEYGGSARPRVVISQPSSPVISTRA